MSGANGSLHGNNLYSYCFNNPVIMIDSSGNWPEWLTNLFGFAEVVEESSEIDSYDCYEGGYSSGFRVSKVISGSFGKLLTFFHSINASETNSIEEKRGAQLNIADKGYIAISGGSGGVTFTSSVNRSSLELALGADKWSITMSNGVDVETGSVDIYQQVYVNSKYLGEIVGAVVDNVLIVGLVSVVVIAILPQYPV